MHKIMFVCHGNICRSPMAEFQCKALTERLGIAKDFEIASSAVSTEEIWNGIGNPVYPPAKAELAKHGIACNGKRARLLTAKDGEYYDLLLCMDESNLRRARRIVGEKNAHKCQKLLTFADEQGDVADPWYTGNFTTTYTDIERGITGLLSHLKENRIYEYKRRNH